MNVIFDKRSSTQPLISIVTPTFNGLQFVSAYLTALSKWKRHNVEVIVIDGGSKDGTVERLSNGVGIDLLVSEKDQGIFDAMNKGLSISRGEYIGILNLDDRYLPSTIDLVSESIASNIHSVIYGGLKIGEGNTDIIHLSHTNIETGMIGHPAMFVARDLYLEFGNFDSSYKVAADYDLTFRFFNAGVSFIELPDVLTEYTPGGFSARHETLSIIETTKIQKVHTNKSTLWFTVKCFLRILKHRINKLL